MWRAISASVIGTSHTSLGSECQDAAEVHKVTANGEPALIFALSDGAGSAKFSGEASKLIVRSFCERTLSILSTKGPDEEISLLSLCEYSREVVINLANATGNPLREYSATLLGGIITPSKGLFVQVGDGGIVIRQDENLVPVTWPDTGEYANTTTFITSDDWHAHQQERVVSEKITDIAAFSDGIQDLALQYSDRTVHARFFTPMMAHLRQSLDPSSLNHSLAEFLNSKAINERTDDDKTLVIACWVD